MITVFKQGLTAFTALLLFSMVAGVSGQTDETIYSQYCVAQPDTSCFDPQTGAVETVGWDVAALGGTFRFCLQLDTIESGSGFAAIRVILVLDESGSMCRDYGECCTEGDGTNNCMTNDPTNQRIIAAHLFVDSLRAMSPQSEVGVVRYEKTEQSYNPLPLTSDNNVERIHDWIDEAACTNTRSVLGKVAKTAETYLGLGLRAGLLLADYNFNRMDPSMARHVILLTDGAWDDIDERSPDEVLDEYARANPDRSVPVVHGVFLSNVELHVAHEYPPEGCSLDRSVDLSNLEYASRTTGGLYFPGSTPENIVTNFQILLDSVTVTSAQQLLELVVVNNTNGEESSSSTVSRIGNGAVWESTLKDLPLDEGANNLEIRQRIYRPGTGDTIMETTNVTIVRSTSYRETIDSDLFKLYCEEKPDVVGPYIRIATLTPGPIATGTRDTLVIEFTEPVVCSELKRGNSVSEVFVVSRGSNDQDAALDGAEFIDGTRCSDDYITSITLLVSPGIDPDLDSIRLSRATVTDAAGNQAQTDKKASIVWGRGADILITSIPDEPGRNLEIPSEVKTGLAIDEDYGKVVRVITRRDLKPLEFDADKRDSVYGTAMVYDAVGNLVCNDLKLYETRIVRNYYTAWDGTNRSGRRVGSGPYLFIFKFQYPDGTPIIKRNKIALRW